MSRSRQGLTMTTSSCPNHQTLASFVHGQLASDAWDAVASHVEDCPTCQDRLDQIEADADGLVTQLQQLPALPAPAQRAPDPWASAILDRAGQVSGSHSAAMSPPGGGG